MRQITEAQGKVPKIKNNASVLWKPNTDIVDKWFGYVSLYTRPRHFPKILLSFSQNGEAF